MIRKTLLASAALGMAVIAAPASAGWTHVHSCKCGHMTCPGTSSGGTTSGGTTSGGTTSGGTTSGGTQVPEPGMLGLVGLTLLGLGAARYRRRR